MGVSIKMEQYFNRCSQKSKKCSVNVLTLTEVFPSLIQPWLVNHLLQIIEHGGDNRVLCRRSELSQFSDSIRENGLLDKYLRVPDSKLELLEFFIRNIGRRVKGSTYENLKQIWQADETPIKQRVMDVLISPAMDVNVDIIHSHIEAVSARTYRLIEAANLPFVMTFHGLTPVGVPHISDFNRQRITRSVETIFANTKFAMGQYVALGAPADKFEIIPQGIDLSRWKFFENAYSREDTLQLLTVGRFHPDKGHIYALKAVQNLKRMGIKVHYTIAGNGPYKNTISNEIQSLAIGDNVTVLEKVSDAELRRLYKNSHVFILPSLKAKDGFHEETQAVVIQEAQASGVLVIATKAGGIPECVDNGKSAFLVNDRSSDEITEQLLELIERADDWHEIRLAARDWVEKKFCSKIIGQKMNDSYLRVLS